jgi:GrpB-like predicted nucleotidyltransferase (UPF0157 family)
MIILEPYNPSWLLLYNQEKELLLTVIKKLNPVIEHIGSTAIPDICAKPTIDIMIGVLELIKNEQYLINQITSLNYEYISAFEEHMPYRRFFQKNNAHGIRTYHIHLVEYNSEFWKRHLLFRDYLKSHPKIAKKYEKLKLKLVAQFTNRNEYAMAKTEFIKEVEKQALVNKANDY